MTKAKESWREILAHYRVVRDFYKALKKGAKK